MVENDTSAFKICALIIKVVISYVPADEESWSTRLTSIPDHSELRLVQMRMRKRYPLISRVEYK